MRKAVNKSRGEFKRLPMEGVLPPDWRRARAVYLLSRSRTGRSGGTNGRYASKQFYDPLTIRYVEFLRKLLGYTSERGMRILAKKQPDLFLAQKVSSETTLRLLEIKARALAGQSDRSIARAVGLPVPVLAAYLGLFFDVRERLAAGTWIRLFVIDLLPDQLPSVETLALWHCWRRGPSVIEPWFDFLHHQGENHDLRTEVGRQRAAIKLLVDVQQLPDTQEVRESLVKKMAYLQQKLPEIPKTASVAGVVCQTAANILGGISWKKPETVVVSPGANPRAAFQRALAREPGAFRKVG